MGRTAKKSLTMVYLTCLASVLLAFVVTILVELSEPPRFGAAILALSFLIVVGGGGMLTRNWNAAAANQLSELLALRIEKHISEDRKTMCIRQQRSKKGNIVKLTLKTDAAYRDIDLCSALARMLDAFIGDRKKGFFFQTRSGKMLSPESFYRDGLKKIFKRIGRTRVRFTAFRRFRESVLLRSECRQVLIDFWMGHENPDMSARYGRQLLEDVKYRKEWAEKVGLGFELPQASKSQASEPLVDVNCATCATDSVEHVCVAIA